MPSRGDEELSVSAKLLGLEVRPPQGSSWGLNWGLDGWLGEEEVTFMLRLEDEQELGCRER